jgi:hypothetical protein
MKRSSITPRQPVKQDMRRPIDTQSTGLRGGAYGGPHINKNRDDIEQVAAYSPGRQGAKKPKIKKWY